MHFAKTAEVAVAPQRTDYTIATLPQRGVKS